MAYSIPFQVYEKLEEKLGKETASIVTRVDESLENQRVKISEDLKKELASKYDIQLVMKEIEIVKKDIDIVKNEVDVVKKEVDLVRREMRFLFGITILIIAVLNQNTLEFIAKIFGLIK